MPKLIRHLWEVFGKVKWIDADRATAMPVGTEWGRQYVRARRAPLMRIVSLCNVGVIAVIPNGHWYELVYVGQGHISRFCVLRIATSHLDLYLAQEASARKGHRSGTAEI